MVDPLTRRGFLSATAAAASVGTLAIGASPQKKPGGRRPVVVAAGSRLSVVEKAMALLKEGADPLDAAIEGVAEVEADPNDHSVGYGGVPNEDGVVELDASVMHGPTHNGGAVGALRNIMHPAAVARLVMQRSRHSLLVGEGALRFARAHGVPEVDLLTDEARKIWLHWKETRDTNWVAPPEGVKAAIRDAVRNPDTGTTHCSALDTHGDLGCVTTTSGWGFKIAGRLGDSPIFGAGLYLDNAAGSCGSTGLGEVNLLNCSCFLIVQGMKQGLPVKDALMQALKQIDENTKRNPRYRDEKGRPNFGLTFYALNRDGDFAGANMVGGATMSVHDGDSAKVVECLSLYD